MAAEPPLELVRRLAASGASGELISASDAVEVHVYLLDGRLAWATTSSDRNAFVAHLVNHHGVSAEGIREVVEECQRTRRRLGETLVSWGLATTAQVRDALGVQIAGALGALMNHESAQSIFLPRRMSYAYELTFDAAELLPTRVASDLEELAATLVATLLDSVHDAHWVEVVEGSEVIARAARARARSPEPLAAYRAVVHDGALDALVVRSGAGVVLGQRLPGRDATVWVGAAPDVKIGVAAALLATIAGSASPSHAAAPAGAAWHERGLRNGRAAVISTAMKNTDDLVAVVLLDADGQATGAWRGSEDELDAHARTCRALLPALHPRVGDSVTPRDQLAGDHVALRGQRGGLVFHGTRPHGGRGTLWLALPTGVSQGLGWALLQALARQTADVGAEVG